jgi:hydroxylaminobenzene mutase
MAHARMGVASHLEGVLNGMFLVVLGLLWTRLVLPGWAAKSVVGLAIYGTFANWLATFLAAFWGAGGMTPVAGGGAAGTAMQEGIVAALLVSLSLAMVALSVLVLWGLARPRKRATPSAVARAPLEAGRAA